MVALFVSGANSVLWAAESNAPPRKFSFQITGRGDLAEHTVLVKDSDFFFASDEKGILYSPLDKSEKEFAFTNGVYRFEIVFRSGRLEKDLVIDDKTPHLVLIDVSSLRAKRETTRKLEELQVNASGRREDSSRSVLTAGEARFIPGSGGDALRSLTSFPGVAPGGAFANGLFIRGGDRFDVLYTYDDIRLGNPFHGIGFYSVFPTSAVENVEFYPGAFPAKFGNSQGAVVEINSKTSYDKTKLLGDFDANLILAGGYLSIPLGKYFQLSFGGRRTYFEFYINLIKSINTNQLPFLAEAQKALTDINLIPSFYDFNIKLDFQPSPQHTFSFVTIGSWDKLSLNTDKFPDSEGQSNSLIVSLESEERWDTEGFLYRFDSKRFKNRAALFRYENTNSRAVQGTNTLRAKLDNYSFVDSALLSPNEFLNIGFGLEYKYQIYPFTVADYPPDSKFFNDALPLSERLQSFGEAKPVYKSLSPIRNVISGYADMELQTGSFRFVPGIRLTANSVNTNLDLDPRLSVIWEPFKNYEVFAKWGFYSQLPSVGYVTPEYGYKDLRSSYAIHYVLGNRLQLGKFEFKLEGYYKDLERLPVANPTFDFIFKSDANNPRYVNEGQGTSYGLELLIRRKLADGFFGWLSYTWNKADRRNFVYYDNSVSYTGTNFDANGGLGYTNVGKAWLPFSQDVQHNLTVIGSLEVVPKFLKLGLRVNLSSGQPYTERIVAMTTNGTLTTVESETKLGERYPIHMTVDFRMDFTFRLFRALDVSFYIDIWNLQFLFYKNVVAYQYPVADLKSDMVGKSAPKTPFYDLPIIPLLGVSVQF